MSKATHGFSPEAYLKYVEGGNPWRTPLIGKIAIYGWKLAKPCYNYRYRDLTYEIQTFCPICYLVDIIMLYWRMCG